MYKYLDKQNTTDNFYTQQTCCPTKRQEKKFVIKLKYLYLSWALWVFLEYTIASWDWMNSKPYVNSREIPLRFVHTGISMASCDQMLQFHSLCLNARQIVQIWVKSRIYHSHVSLYELSRKELKYIDNLVIERYIYQAINPQNNTKLRSIEMMNTWLT
jgi:hypothetical protein